MFKTYVLIALRNLYKNKSFSAINILGLALGMTCSLLIFLWSNDERQMDKFSDNTERIFTVYQRQHTEGSVKAQYGTPALLPGELKRVYPEVEYAAGYGRKEIFTFQAGDKTLKKEGSYAGPDFFKIFTFEFLEGNAGNALKDPLSMAISRNMATEFFGSPQLAMGKTIRFEGKRDFRVAAVFENIPDNSSVEFEYLLNWDAFLEQYSRLNSWDKNAGPTYIKFKQGVDGKAFAKQVTHFLDKYIRSDPGHRVELDLQRYDEMYLYSNFNAEGRPDSGRIEYVRLFSLVSVFILLIACINFMNLTTAASISRAREIGVRKAVGALRSSLIWQFIGEAVVLAFISIAIALLLVALVLQPFNTLIQKDISFPLMNGYFWLFILGIALVCGLVSGSYPAFFLSSFNPVKVLKGTLKLSGGNTAFRKGLVVFQFILSIILIIGTIVVSRQVDFIQTKNLGYSRQDLIYIPQDGELKKRYSLFKDEALKMPGIDNISRIGDAPTNITSSTWGVDWEGKDPNNKLSFNLAGVGYDFAKNMKLEIVQGRDFSRNFASDSVGYVLNEEAVKLVGYEQPVGRSFTLWGNKGTIVGVVKDFHFNSLHTPVNPMVMFLDEYDQHGGYILVRTQAGKSTQAIASLNALWDRLNPGFPFAYQFADEEYDKLYRSEQMVGNLSDGFAFLAILISCLGLFGLAMFTTNQRTREISIRKVLGANTATLFGLLSKEFIVLVFVALLIATPLAWLFMNTWLKDFAYRVSISWWIFVVAGFASILIALITISFQIIKVITLKPVKTLRSE